MNRNLQPFKGTHLIGMVLLNANTSINADASVGTNNNPSVGAWTNPSTGVYRFTAKDPISPPTSGQTLKVFATPTFEAATPVDLVPQIKAKSITGGVLVVDVVLMTGAVATAPAAACALNLVVWVKDSSANP